MKKSEIINLLVGASSALLLFFHFMRVYFNSGDARPTVSSINDGIIIFFGSVATVMIIAMMAEFMAARRTREWNPWIAFLSGTTVMFRLYWFAWLCTLRSKDLTPYVDHETERMKLLITLILFVFTAFFVPSVLLAAGRVWADRQKCGAVISLLRLVSVVGFAYLFLSTLIFAVNFVANIQTSL